MIRNDFVSNSSSSSFIIGFRDEKTKDKFLKEIIKGWGSKGKSAAEKFDEDNKITLSFLKKSNNNKLYERLNRNNDVEKYPILYIGHMEHFAMNEIDLFIDHLINLNCREREGMKILESWAW